MYIRNAQGQLMWIPPKGYGAPPPPTLPTLQALQQNMRQQMQMDNWARFNAPPPQDNLCFHDDFSCYEGTPSNGFHSVAPPPCNSPSMANHVNMMHQAQQPQQPYNRMNLPIPQVINSSPMLTSPRNPAPSHRTNPPMSPQVITNTSPMLMSPRNQVPSHIGLPPSRGPPSVAGFRGPPSVVGGRGPPSVVVGRGPPSVVGFRGSGGPPSVIAAPDNLPLSPLHEEIKLVKEEFVPETNVSCMSTIFGSSVDLYKSEKRSRKVGLMNCDALNISISSDDDEDFAGNSLSYSSHRKNTRKFFQCNGVRGPGKRFDYFYESKKSESTDWERDTKSTASSEHEGTEKSLDDYVDALQMDKMKITEQDIANNVKTNHVTSPRLYDEETNDPAVSRDCRENLGSYSTGGAVAEDDSIDDRSGIIDEPPMTRDFANHTRNITGQEVVKQVEKPFSDHEQTEDCRDEVETRDEEDSRDFSNENDKKVTNYFAAKNYPTFNRHIVIPEDFPSFDEPDFPSFDEPANPSDGENDQHNANIYHKVDQPSDSKRVPPPKETRAEMPLSNSRVMN